jgi:hypothetical protein
MTARIVHLNQFIEANFVRGRPRHDHAGMGCNRYCFLNQSVDVQIRSFMGGCAF